jgi:hypothetical protein
MNGFIPAFGAGSFSPPVLPSASNTVAPATPTIQSISLADIYQAAMTRAMEDVELDKLFNPDFYNYEI